MLDHLAEGQAAARIRAAVRSTLQAGDQVTADIRRQLTGSADGAVGTRAYGAAVASAVSALA